MSKIGNNVSLTDLLNLTNKYLAISIAVFSAVFLLGSSLILYKSHETSCGLFNAKMESAEMAISRELALGETKVANFLFDRMKKSLETVSYRTTIHLFPGSNTKEKSACNPSIIKAHISKELSFSGETVGYIIGDITSLNLLHFFTILVSILVSLTAILHIMKDKLISKIKEKIIDPITKLCNQEIIQASNLPLEVIEIANKMEALRTAIAISEKSKLEVLHAEKLWNIANQVAHDIRSPLGMLRNLEIELLHLPENSKIQIQTSINRIEEIAHNLLRSNQINASYEEMNPSELRSLLRSIISEKRIEYNSNLNLISSETIDNNNSYFFSVLQRSAFKSIISNLVNNSVEAIDGGEGTIDISLFESDRNNIIIVKDTGPGIPVEFQQQLFQKGVTSKNNGNGIALYYAKESLSAIGGTITFSSSPKGTEFIIQLPKTETPASLVTSLALFAYEKIIIVDDEVMYHELWDRQLTKFQGEIKHYFSTSDLLRQGTLENNTLLLSDFDLLEDCDGIDLIINLNHCFHSALVTARHEDPKVVRRCQTAKIKLIPKSMISLVDFVFEFPEVVLIDDDKWVQLSWKRYFENKTTQLRTFNCIEDFLQISSDMDRTIPIYIDCDLGNNIRGEEESKKINVLGFKNLYLSTGYEKDFIGKPVWIKAIYTKDPKQIFNF